MKKYSWAGIFLLGSPVLIIWSFLTLNWHTTRSSTSPGVLGFNTQVDTQSFVQSPKFSVTLLTADAREKIIKNYLHQYNSPLEPHSRLIVEISDNYGLDYRLLVAIAQQESNLCKKIPPDSHNCWGYGIYGDKITGFEDYPHAIETVARGLKKNYIDLGLVTPSQIMVKYTPPSVEKGGPWAKAVTQFLSELE